MRWEQLLLLFIFWLPMAGSSSAQQSANPPSAVTGIVRTSEGTPVPGSTVRLIDTVTNKVWMSWTDQSGKFEFPQIADGHYRIESSQLGFVQTSLVVEVPIVPPGPIPIILRVATLAELSATPGNPAPNSSRPAGNRQGRGQNAPPNSANAPASNAPGSGRGAGGRGQVPAGVSNAISAGLAGGGFEQTELTGEGTNPQASESNTQANEGPQAGLALSAGNNSSATSDSFLLQGTVGQSLVSGGPGGSGLGGIVPGTPGDQGGRGGPGGRGGGQLFGQG
ncbi:MAG: carboxypeptidase-like regulatory domain-containing protein, partial [Candidatus Acidiferrales bacterium]